LRIDIRFEVDLLTYFASRKQPLACCYNDRKHPKSPLASTDFGTDTFINGDMTWLFPAFQSYLH